MASESSEPSRRTRGPHKNACALPGGVQCLGWDQPDAATIAAGTDDSIASRFSRMTISGALRLPPGLNRRSVPSRVANRPSFVKGVNLEEFPAHIEKRPLLVSFNGIQFDVPFLRTRFPEARLDQPHIVQEPEKYRGVGQVLDLRLL